VLQPAISTCPQPNESGKLASAFPSIKKQAFMQFFENLRVCLCYLFFFLSLSLSPSLCYRWCSLTVFFLQFCSSAREREALLEAYTCIHTYTYTYVYKIIYSPTVFFKSVALHENGKHFGSEKSFRFWCSSLTSLVEFEVALFFKIKLFNFRGMFRYPQNPLGTYHRERDRILVLHNCTDV